MTIYPAGSVNSTSVNSEPYFKKYWDPTFNDTGGNGDLYMMRLAEMYLTAAEAEASLGNRDEAIKYINVLLARARHTDSGEAAQPADWKASDFATDSDLIHAIVWEREFEMSFECHEFFDTHRRGATFLSEHIAQPANDFLRKTYQKTFVNSLYPFTDKHIPFEGGDPQLGYPERVEDLRKSLVCGFPQNELEYNTAITREAARNDFVWR